MEILRRDQNRGLWFKKVVVDNESGRYSLQLEGRYLVMSGIPQVGCDEAASLLLQDQEIEPL